MPTYRKLHTKVLDSADFNTMPDDFTRVFWLVLPLRCDREGRAFDDPHWLRSVLFPRRRDVTTEQIESCMGWLSERHMIKRYQVCGESYFHIISWAKHQTGTEREAPSYIPPPPDETHEELTSASGVNQEGVKHAVPVPDTDTVPVIVPECVKAAEAVKLPTHPAEVGARIEQPEAEKPAVHPALQVWRDTHGGKYPHGDTWQTIIGAVGDDPVRVERWKEIVSKYIEIGWNPVNVAGMLDFFKRDELPATGQKHNGTQGKGKRVTAHWDAKLKADLAKRKAAQEPT